MIGSSPKVNRNNSTVNISKEGFKDTHMHTYKINCSKEEPLYSNCFFLKILFT